MTSSGGRRLVLDDIVDLRAYERTRPDRRDRIMALKAKRRVAVGPLCTLLFENRDTIHWQIQEMARAEKIISDDGILAELAAYNPLIPEPGQLSATMFVELTSEVALREWLPKLVGIERHVVVQLADGSGVRAVVEAAHDAQLTRDDITSTVHYVRWELTPGQVAAFSAGPVTVAVDHPAYVATTVLSADTQAELLTDLLADPVAGPVAGAVTGAAPGAAVGQP